VPGDFLTQIGGQHAVDVGLTATADVGVLQAGLAAVKDRLDKLELAQKSPPEGLHNATEYSQHEWFDRVERGDSYKDRSLLMVFPAYKPVAPAVWASWLSLLTPANHRVYRYLLYNYEVGQGYERAVEVVLNDPVLSKFEYLLTLEADNVIPSMAVLQLFEDADKADVDVLGAMYWGKGAGGVPMAYGRFGDVPHNFRPFVPPANSVTRVNGCGMGCTLFKLDLFRKVSRPWFKTHQEWTPNVGMETLLTQDLWFMKKAAAEAGAKVAVTTNVLVGHLDEATGITW
jgi:hypothetical protein